MNKFILILIFIFIGVSARLLPHFPNATPLMAIGLFGGAYLSRKLSFAAPVAIMLVSDAIIGFYDLKLMVFVYFSLLMPIFLGFLIKKNKKWGNIFILSIVASFSFFLITNFAVWAFYPWYSRDLAGLVNCYLMALPFFRNALFGDLFYVAVFFGAYKTAESIVKHKNFSRRNYGYLN
ncbi:MAG: hypothetical protein A2365_00680 [Candidatus Nealsonbacteria bacterium RIFOXYB1_FULL_40_15]|uniref:Rod shape-determining protein MreD n=2 Tax=Candidatus Nealsoniibacteriota TaxID=1817911 RepID=A0A1G2ESJ3_9BACT|nr:MAG: hypothetical protein A2365_00680 [Candidatus Nealsonbacteria bacterium RIFOXYB1_FULL_40_15]OGZ28784.1 MAG: hypothetical protein A2427_01860 [Candidatus Nealsonbacteria bacterium RIFOXYC1_FULL_40_7]OGZ29062.1 MAG: hypothetical protein A2562_01115 [Candidatus Nealsonbacteria bacterium RIFOXYD1_FULL_39_11]